MPAVVVLLDRARHTNKVQSSLLIYNSAGELVVDQLMIRYGPRRSKWPKKLLRTLEKRNAALVAAIIERLCYVPKEHFWPLGSTAKELITGKEGKSHLTSCKSSYTSSRQQPSTTRWGCLGC